MLSSAVLNRVVGLDPSSLLGQLQSNGRVYLINPNGIVFGAGARIDVAGLVGSTLDLGDADFLAGRLQFRGTPSAGAIRQLGAIRTPSGGQVLLIAPRIDNAGTIHAPGGEVVLAAGQSVQLVDTANPALRVSVSAAPGEIVNLGQLLAEGGRIGIHAGLIRQAGTISADRAELGPAGEVYLKAGDAIVLAPTSRIGASADAGGQITLDAAGSLRVSGELSARGRAGSGGTVQLLGRELSLDAATVDASGAAPAA